MLFDGVTRPLRARMMARQFGVTKEYASAVLAIMDMWEAGKITEREFMRAGVLLGEQYPEDYKRARRLIARREEEEREASV